MIWFLSVVDCDFIGAIRNAYLGSCPVSLDVSVSVISRAQMKNNSRQSLVHEMDPLLDLSLKKCWEIQKGWCSLGVVSARAAMASLRERWMEHAFFQP